MKKYDGFFITFEGGEGAGKTAQLKLLADRLEAKGRDVVITREPGGVDVAEKIRSVLLDTSVTEMDALTEVFLYAAARREHLQQVILPALRSGKIVLCDRYLDSSVVYQGIAKGLGWKTVYDINLTATSHTLPDVTYYFHIKPEIALRRIKPGQREINRFDRAPLAFHERVQTGYLFLLKLFSDRIIMINADQSKKAVHEEMFQDLDMRLFDRDVLGGWENVSDSQL